MSNRDGDERRPEPPKRANSGTHVGKIQQWRSPDHMGKADAERHIGTPMHVSYVKATNQLLPFNTHQSQEMIR